MYYPETYFTEQVLAEVLKQYSWPEKYKLEDSPPNSVSIKFQRCTLLVAEGFESEMYACFLNRETGRSNTQASLGLFDAVGTVETTHNPSEEDTKLLNNLVRFLEVEPSIEKVKQGLHNICILLQVYLLPCIQGDFSWVDEYNKQNQQ